MLLSRTARSVPFISPPGELDLGRLADVAVIFKWHGVIFDGAAAGTRLQTCSTADVPRQVSASSISSNRISGLN
jgi:hypothetical protein